jgi:hypothetical protein
MDNYKIKKSWKGEALYLSISVKLMSEMAGRGRVCNWNILSAALLK